MDPGHEASRQIRGDWLMTIRRYLAALLVLNLSWETAHLPLFTIWREGSGRDLLWAVLHCTGGDLLIGTASLILSLILLGDAEWPRTRSVYWRVAAAAIAFGIAYTIFSEWLNVEVRRAWAYSAAMPVVPVIGIGLSPLAQWLVVPTLSFLVARRAP